MSFSGQPRTVYPRLVAVDEQAFPACADHQRPALSAGQQPNDLDLMVQVRLKSSGETCWPRRMSQSMKDHWMAMSETHEHRNSVHLPHRLCATDAHCIMSLRDQ